MTVLCVFLLWDAVAQICRANREGLIVILIAGLLVTITELFVGQRL